ncbi:hypothetical protein IGI37_002225 [Enterococcus sp. AZ194]|uniref:hypothetical protein n=1 Tax=Enterococcus sp. AZ194 TaxID=2774629 RepID=UPI003F299424
MNWETSKGPPIRLLQLTVSPDAWCQYYKKEKKKAQYQQDYEEMYIVVPVTNQTDQDMNELVDYVVQSGIPKRPFVASVLGAYPGVPRINQYPKYTASENPIVLRQKRRQRIRQVLCICFIIFVALLIGVKQIEIMRASL